MPALALATLDEPRCPLLAGRPRRRRRRLHVVAEPPDPEKHAGPVETGPDVSAWVGAGGTDQSNAVIRWDVLARSAERRAVRLAAYDGTRRLVVEDHLGLVRTIAAKYVSAPKKRAKRRPIVEFDDLVSAGSIGLMQALAKFDPAKGFKFSTCAVPWIQSAIQRAYDRSSRVIAVPEYRIQGVKAAHRDGRPLTAEQERIDALGRVDSLDRVHRGEHGESTTLAEQLRDDGQIRRSRAIARHRQVTT